MDVVLDPLQGRHLVQHPGVARHLPGPQREEAQWPKSVVECDQDDPVNHPEVGTKPAGSTAAKHKGSTMDPDSHREEVMISGEGRDVNIEVETVLGTAGQQAIIAQTKAYLRTDRVPLLQYKT